MRVQRHVSTTIQRSQWLLLFISNRYTQFFHDISTNLQLYMHLFYATTLYYIALNDCFSIYPLWFIHGHNYKLIFKKYNNKKQITLNESCVESILRILYSIQYNICFCCCCCFLFEIFNEMSSMYDSDEMKGKKKC